MSRGGSEGGDLGHVGARATVVRLWPGVASGCGVHGRIQPEAPSALCLPMPGVPGSEGFELGLGLSLVLLAAPELRHKITEVFPRRVIRGLPAPPVVMR